MSAPFGDGGTGSEGGTLGAAGQGSGVDDTTLADSQSETSGSGESSGSGGNSHPSTWDEILNVVPSQFHNVFKPKLQEWDQNYNKLAQEYAPFKQFAQQGVQADVLNKAYTLYQMIDQNPQEIYRRLGEALGQQQQQQNQGEEEFEYGEENDPGIQGDPEDPRFQQLMQQVQQLQQQNQGFQQQYLENQYSQQIDSEIRGLQQKHGNFDVGDVMNRFLAQMQRGENPSISRAFAEQQQYNANYAAMQQQNGGRQAPQVLSPNGGIPSGQEQISLKTQEDRVEAAKRMIASSQS